MPNGWESYTPEIIYFSKKHFLGNYYGRYALMLLKYAIHTLTYHSHNTIKDEYFEISNHSLVRGNKGTDGVNDKISKVSWYQELQEL